tara:strand:+ start:2112 stop:2792 length:681 start_codon:yes stop_codon:yes gene_type:complete
MDINVHVLNAISKVFVTIQNVNGNNIKFDIFKTINDVLQIDGKYCTQDMFDMHIEYMIHNEILGHDDETGYYLIHDENTLLSKTASKIYSKLYFLGDKTQYKIGAKKSHIAYDEFELVDESDQDEDSEKEDESEKKNNPKKEDESDQEEKFDEIYQMGSFTSDKVYNICIEKETNKLSCSCLAFGYNPHKECKHIKHLRNIQKGDISLQQSFPSIYEILLETEQTN